MQSATLVALRIATAFLCEYPHLKSGSKPGKNPQRLWLRSHRLSRIQGIFMAYCTGVRAMNEVDQDNEPLQFDVPDAFLESSAGGGHDNTNIFTQWVCTAVNFCPGP